MSEFFSEQLAGLAPYVPGEQPKKGERYVKLNTNESPFPPSPAAIKAGKEALSGLNLYSDPTAYELRKVIAAELNVPPETVTVSNGSDEALAFIMRGFCAHGAVLNDITYGFYRVLASLLCIKTEIVPLTDELTIDVGAYERTKGTVFIANPNAPTGIALPPESIARVARFDRKRPVVADEAYVDFGAESAVKLIKTDPNVVVVRTFSKSRSLAGARLGFTLSSPEVAADIERVRNSFNPYNVNAVTQRMGAAAMADREYFSLTRGEIMKNRQKLTMGLEKLGFYLTDSMANFVFASPPDGDGERMYAQMKRRGVLVRYFDEARIKRFVRITVGSDRDVDALLEAAADIYGGEKNA